MYDPINSMQAIYGAIGSYWNEEPDEKGCYTMRDLKDGETAGELKSKNELLGPTEQLTEDYGTYYYLEDRAQQRIDDIRDFWFQYVDSTEYYPSVVLTEEKTAHWLTDGGIEDEWDDYVSAMDSMGLQDVVAAWQAAYDRYVEAQ